MILAGEAAQIAARAAREWGAGAKPPELITIRENAVFRAEQATGRVIALRLHRPGYQSRAGIEAELNWTLGLAAQGLPVPEPIPTGDGALTWRQGDVVVSAVGWLDGAPLGRADTVLAGDRAAQEKLFAALGRLLAGFHRATDVLALPADLPRPRWDGEGLLGANPTWGRFWENPGYRAEDQGLIAAVRAFALERLRHIGTAAPMFGLIHADVMRENVLIAPDGTLNLIDFDDSGYGYRLYDLGTALVQSLEEPNLPFLAGALLEGYAAGGGNVGNGPQDLMLFTLLRSLASTGWIDSRAPEGDPRRKLYVERALRLSARVAEGRCDWP